MASETVGREIGGTTTQGSAVLIEIEQPQPGDVLHPGDSLLGFGWVLAASPVRGIDVGLDGAKIAQAVTGLARTDVHELHPDIPGSDRAGFTFVAKVPGAAAAEPELQLTVRQDAGEQTYRVPLIFAGPAPAQQPAPRPARPVTAAPPLPSDLTPIRVEIEEARIDAAGFLLVRGWTVTALTTESVDVLVAGESVGFADKLLSREDVGAAFPAYPDSANAGFLLKTPLPTHLVAADTVAVVVTDATGSTAMSQAPLIGAAQAARAKAPLEPLLATLEEARVTEIGVLRVRGWAVGLSKVEHVRVYLDETLIGMAAQRQPREDVGLAYPDYADSGSAGFLLQQDMPDGPLEGHTVRVNLTASGGIRRDLTAPLIVAPTVKRRQRAAPNVEFHCDNIALSGQGALTIKGWAVCSSGVASIDVDLGDEAMGQADLGEERPDVGNHFPHIASARTSGFRFLGRASGRCEGEYIARVTVHGRGGEHRVVQLPVLAVADAPEVTAVAASAEDRGIRFFLDTPAIKDGRATETVRGFLPLNGWAFSAAGIASIEVIVDERSLGQAYRGIRREDLHQAFGRKEALRSGFAMLIPPQVLKRGRHAVRVVITDASGLREEVAFTVDAEPSMDGPGPWSLRGKLTQAEIDLHMSMISAAGAAPEFCLLLSGGGSAAAARRLPATLDSLRHLAYPAWRLLLVAGSDDEADAMAAAVAMVPGVAKRAEVVRLGAGQPLAALAQPSCGSPGFLLLLEAGDQLGEDALLELALERAVRPAADFLYADERRHDPSDGETRAFFKPDWSPDLLLSTNYIGRIWAARASLLEQSGAVFGDLARHGEYDLVLRLTEQAQQIVHVPKVLAARGQRSLDTPAVERRALARALVRRGVAADVQSGCLPGTYRVRRAIRRPGKVSIIIPSIASRGLIEIAVRSIRKHTPRDAYEIVLLDNIRPEAPAELVQWKSWFREHCDVVVEINEKFNWSRFNNIGAQNSSGDYFLFLNDDIEVHTDDWLDGLLELAQRDDVGAVGPQLLYPDGKVQHAGMFLSGSVGRHAFRFSPRDEPGPFGLALTQRNVIAVTGACMLVRRDVFDAIGGFDEEHSVINNDLDYCLRVNQSGRRVIYTPHVTLTHHEMVSRGEMRDVFNAAHFESRWKQLFLTGDPYFNPNLAMDVDDYVPEQEPFRLVHVGHPVISRHAVKRILAVKLDHIGDFIASFPALRRLKHAFPNAELTVLAAGASLALAPLEPAIDRIIRFDFFHAKSERGRKSVTRKDLVQLQDELSPLGFDLAIDLRRQPDTRQILRYTGARWLAGFDKENRTAWLDIAVEWEGDVARTNKRTHISDALVQFVDAVTVACEDERRVIPGAASREAARAALPKLSGLQDFTPRLLSRRLICLHLGAGAENKRWPTASFAGLADLLIDTQDVDVVVIGGPDEAEMAREFLHLVRHKDRAFSAVGKLGLRDLPVLLSCANLYVGNDSGPKHIASALGVPTVGIHSGSVDAVEWGPMGPAAFGVRRAVTCSPCYIAKAADCPRSLACLHGIRVSDVLRACQRMLALSPHEPAVAQGEVRHNPEELEHGAVFG